MSRLSVDTGAIEFVVVDVRAALDLVEEGADEVLDELPAGVCL